MALLREHARRSPHKVAAQMAGTGETLTYGKLDQRSANLANHLVEIGVQEGDAIAVLIGNSLRYFEVAWAARRCGAYYVPISTHLTPDETEYILRDSGASVLFTTSEMLARTGNLQERCGEALRVILVDSVALGESSYSQIVDAGSMEPRLPARRIGLDMAYSSGTTGRPKGIKQKLFDEAQMAKVMAAEWLSFFKFTKDTVYLSPAPLYHAAPLRFCMRCIVAGGTAVVMDRFDAQRALELIQEHKVTHSQWVPTMFSRMLALPEAVRSSFDVSSMQRALHAAAPCPKDVKLKMLEWWGPIIWEYYSGSERNGATVIAPDEWLQHQGSVGRAVSGELRIVGEDGDLCAAREEGLVYFKDGPKFEYHNDPEKTAASYNAEGWSTIGDIGYVDEDGYLFLTDRRSNMIISGGVNIYPQEAENVLLGHPLVADAAVFGVPHPDFGEQVVAVVHLRLGSAPSDEIAEQLSAYCRERLSHIKCPRIVDFSDELPRTETGKLLKRVVRDNYRAALKAHDQQGAASEKFWRLNKSAIGVPN